MEYVCFVPYQFYSGYIHQLFTVRIPFLYETFTFFETMEETATRSRVTVLVCGTVNALNTSLIILFLFQLPHTFIFKVLPVVHEMYTGRYHFNSFEFVASRPGHHVDAEFHAGRHVQKERGSTVHVQFHCTVLIHDRIHRRREILFPRKRAF